MDGTVCFSNNTALTQAVALTAVSSSVFLNGTVSILDNVAHSDYSAVVVLQYSEIHTSGLLTFSDNVGFTEAFCVLAAHSNCTFVGTNVFQNSISDRPPHFFQNCTIEFFGNTTFSNNTAAVKYGGGIGISESKLLLDDTYSFINNRSPPGDGGAIYAIDSTVILGGRGEFLNNNAKHGGAIHLFYQSKIDFRTGLSVLFKQNTALVGGAINVEEVVSFINCTNDNRLRFVYSSPPACFFDVDSGNDIVTLNFEDNEATNGGRVLYGGMLDRCLPIFPHNRSVLDVFMNIAHFNDSTTSNQTSLAISSEPFRLCFCDNDQSDCLVEERVLQVTRGQSFSVTVAAMDQLNATIVALVRSYLVSGFNDTDRILGNEGILQKVNNKCTDLSFQVITPNDIEQLVMYVEGPCRDVGNATKSLQIHLLECPAGFTLQIDRCVCDPRLSAYTDTCNVDTGGIERMTNFWVGAIYGEYNNSFEGLILYPNCPFDYCMWPSADVALTAPDVQCNYNRSGILCGSCIEDTSLLLGGSECSHCSFYYLFLLVPFALMGILLVVGLFLLQLTVATGSIHGLIFYANIVIVNKAVLITPDTFKGFTVFISWLNLDFGIQTCFFTGMDQYVKTWLQFLFPAYLLALVLFIIIICHYSVKASRLFGSNPVAVLATVILLSYAKILRNILDAFSYATVEYPSESVKVWLLDGNLIYAQGKHAVLFSVVLLILVFLFFPYTILLIFAQFFKKVSYISSSSLFRKLVPFIDAYHAPYKVAHRYWTGLFLLVRCLLLVTFALNSLGDSSVNLLAITTVCFGVGTVSWVIGGVYKRRILDALEAASTLNLGMFAAATYHVKVGASGNQTAVASTSICIAFILFIAILVAQIYFRIRVLFKSEKKAAPTNVLQEPNNLVDEDAGARNVNHTTFQVVPPPIKTIEMLDASGNLREPLLED